jgi:hypothetical protein
MAGSQCWPNDDYLSVLESRHQLQPLAGPAFLLHPGLLSVEEYSGNSKVYYPFSLKILNRHQERVGLRKMAKVADLLILSQKRVSGSIRVNGYALTIHTLS